MPDRADSQLATLGGGCFWCLEAVFQQLKGVQSVVSGFAGGEDSNPSYKSVCNGQSGHAEVVQIAFDPHAISFAELLDVFFHTHDPTTLNRQGNDLGTQYRSIILCHNDEQLGIANETKSRLQESGEFSDSLVTEIVDFDEFFPAGDDHQNYYREHDRQPYCQMVIRPKVEKFQKAFPERLRGTH